MIEIRSRTVMPTPGRITYILRSPDLQFISQIALHLLPMEGGNRVLRDELMKCPSNTAPKPGWWSFWVDGKK